jgi:hypothetical protein
MGPRCLHVSSILTFNTIQLLLLCFKAMHIGVPCHVMPNALGVSPHWASLIMACLRHHGHLDHHLNTNKVRNSYSSTIIIHYFLMFSAKLWLPASYVLRKRLTLVDEQFLFSPLGTNIKVTQERTNHILLH